MVNINVEIPDALHRRLKVEAAIRGTTLKEYLIETLDKELPKEVAK